MIAKQNNLKFSDPLLILAVVTTLSLLPFVGKAFNIDEPLFIWVARHIQSSPLDFYGFRINWYGTETSAAEIVKNPPLASYYIALAGFVGGWSEVSLHIAFLVPALAVVIGTYFLARELSQQPMVAALVGLLTPVFIISSSTVMCDTMMLASYVWAVLLWVRGIKNHDFRSLLIASFLVALSSLTKYFGMSLIPLLSAYVLSSKKVQKQRGLILLLLIPFAILCCYQWGTTILYGRGLLTDAASYANAAKNVGLKSVFADLATGLSFAGGCFLPTLFLIPLLWSRRTAVLALTVAPLLTLVLTQIVLNSTGHKFSWGYLVQISLSIIAGIQLLALASRDLWENRDSESLLLFLWVMGTFLFASLINWSVNGRSILPLVPAVGILIARGLSRYGHSFNETQLLRSKSLIVALTFAWLLSMTVAWADYSFAGTARRAAETIGQYHRWTRGPLVFQGHWGFQYYMEQKGAMAFDFLKPYPKPLVMAVPTNNTNVNHEIVKRGTPLQTVTLTPLPFLTTMDSYLGAGFYSDLWGALPFAFGNVTDEIYTVVLLE